MLFLITEKINKPVLSSVHIKSDNEKYNYNDNYICVEHNKRFQHYVYYKHTLQFCRLPSLMSSK